MKVKKLLTTALLVPVTIAHHVITNFLVDNVRQTNVIRQPGTLNPIINPNSIDLGCGYPLGNGQGMKGTDKALIYPGSNITFEWHINWSNSVSGPEGVTDISHKGPCAIYMRKVQEAVTADATDTNEPNWFKIWEDGVDESGIFCTSRMRLNGGFFSGTIPKHLENGDYLIRAETITLNNAGEPNRQPQWYVGCAQVTLKDSEAPFIKPVTVRIPSGDYANMNMPGLRYNIWYPERNSYPDYGPVPGPAVFNDGSGLVQEPEEPSLSTILRHVTFKTTPLKEVVTVTGFTSTLPSGFSTIPWPTPTTLPTNSEKSTQSITTAVTFNQPTSTSTFSTTATTTPTLAEDGETHVHVVTRTVTQRVTRTVLVTKTPTPIIMHSRIPYRHTEVVRSTRLVTITRTVFTGKYTTPTPTMSFQTAEPTVANTPTPASKHKFTTVTMPFQTAQPTATNTSAPSSEYKYATHVRRRGFQYRRRYQRHTRMRRG